MLTLRHPLLCAAVPQWEHHRSLLQIWTRRHPAVSSTDNPVHDLTLPRRWAENPSTSEELSGLYLFSVSSYLGQPRPLPWLAAAPQSSLGARHADLASALPLHGRKRIWILLSWLIQLQGRWHGVCTWLTGVSPFYVVDSSAWAWNDGVVNTVSQGAPRGQRDSGTTCTVPLPEPTVPSELRRGMWYAMSVQGDHLKSKSMPWLKHLAWIVDGLPAAATSGSASRRRACVS